MFRYLGLVGQEDRGIEEDDTSRIMWMKPRDGTYVLYENSMVSSERKILKTLGLI